MLSDNECLKILNKKDKNYTNEQAVKIKILLYQLGELSYLLFDQNNKNEESNNIYKSIYRQAS